MIFSLYAMLDNVISIFEVTYTNSTHQRNVLFLIQVHIWAVLDQRVKLILRIFRKLTCRKAIILRFKRTRWLYIHLATLRLHIYHFEIKSLQNASECITSLNSHPSASWKESAAMMLQCCTLNLSASCYDIQLLVGIQLRSYALRAPRRADATSIRAIELPWLTGSSNLHPTKKQFFNVFIPDLSDGTRWFPFLDYLRGVLR